VPRVVGSWPVNLRASLKTLNLGLTHRGEERSCPRLYVEEANCNGSRIRKPRGEPSTTCVTGPRVVGEALARGVTGSRAAGEALARVVTGPRAAGEALARGVTGSRAAGEALARGVTGSRAAGEALVTGVTGSRAAGEALVPGVTGPRAAITSGPYADFCWSTSQLDTQDDFDRNAKYIAFMLAGF